MKKILFTSLLALSASLFAQEIISTAFSPEMTGTNNNLGFGIISTVIGVFFYVILPILLYCISSYSLALLNKHYNKQVSSKISWIPFARYYDFVKHATKSGKKAFIITLLPWIVSLIGLSGVIIIGMRGIVGGIPSELVIFASIFGIGFLSIVAMNFWRAFIIAKHVKGDITTALGLSTYTAIVLWYIALDRVKKNTNIIGIFGFATLGLVVCFYIGIILMFGLSGLAQFLGV